MPVVAAHIEAGDVRAAVEAAGTDWDMPEPSGADNLVLAAWRAVSSPLAAGGGFQVFTMHADAAGLGSLERIEAWHRVALVVDPMIAAWRARGG